MKGLLALMVFMGTQAFAAEKFSPQISPDSGRPALSLRVDQSTGAVYVHTNGQWKRARHFEESMAANNSVEATVSPDSSWLSNFFYGSYYNYGYNYPNNYYYYTPSSSLWYGGYSYAPYNNYSQNNYWYRSYWF